MFVCNLSLTFFYPFLFFVSRVLQCVSKNFFIPFPIYIPMSYFYKFTQSGKGIVTSSEPLTGQSAETKTLGGVEVPVRKQTGDVKFGFTAVDPALSKQMQVQVGDELPLEITSKPVQNEDGDDIPNLFWAE